MPKGDAPNAATMITNNNLDYEKNSNTSSTGSNTAPAATATALATATTTTTASTAMSNSNGSANSSNNSSPTSATNANVNDNSNSNNSYFNRFDNRIAANLAAVITGARFRSSSCSSRTTNNANASHNKPHDNAARAAMGVATSAARTLSQHYNSMATLARSKAPCMSSSSGSSQSRPASPAPPTTYGSPSPGRRRPLQLFTPVNLNCNDNDKVAQTPSSDEDNSPTELNNCKRLTDKPPLVKRLTMGLLRHNEESCPLVSNATPITGSIASTTPTLTHSTALVNQLRCSESDSNPIYSNGYINEDSYIDSKFGDSCRQSLTAIPMLDNVNVNDNSEFNLKKRYLRETSSANSSPKIFANRLRVNNATTLAAGRYNNPNTHSNSSGSINQPSNPEEEEAELKDACWYQAGISRDIAVEVLQSKSPGAFLVRKSTSKPGCYALTLRVPSPPGPKIANYIILRTARGYKIKGFRKEFSSLKALITHHSVMPELLPVPLAMPRPTNMSSSRRNLDDFDTYDSLQMLLKYLRAKDIEGE
ncbi:dual specificity protein kinase splA [Scaptodrosophila lebanonensis]|uniref:Dual specificity protein kinase splA n=1 Tax=Drosophila lebanonensis TaxID=7225 RepID=A0A6J2UBT8_DROLE|nr:dual specificity protein kinase splA [Scaptodrosophila lebanonensis]